MPVKIAAKRFVGIDMTVDRLVADRHFSRDLFRAPLALQIGLNRQPIRWLYLPRIMAVHGSLLRHKTGLFGTIAPQTRIAGNLPADRCLMSPEIDSNLRLRQPLFQQCGNLVSFSSAEMAIGHCASSTVRSREPTA